jgi:hypothetical protein
VGVVLGCGRECGPYVVVVMGSGRDCGVLDGRGDMVRVVGRLRGVKGPL